MKKHLENGYARLAVRGRVQAIARARAPKSHQISFLRK